MLSRTAKRNGRKVPYSQNAGDVRASAAKIPGSTIAAWRSTRAGRRSWVKPAARIGTAGDERLATVRMSTCMFRLRAT